MHYLKLKSTWILIRDWNDESLTVQAFQLCWNQLESLLGIETWKILILGIRNSLKSTWILIRDWNVELLTAMLRNASWNQLESLLGIETFACWVGTGNLTCWNQLESLLGIETGLSLITSLEVLVLKSTWILIRDWNNICSLHS